MQNGSRAAETGNERLRRREELLRGQNAVLKLIIENAPLRTVLEELTSVAERHSDGGFLASILLLDRDGVHLRHGAAPSLPAAYSQAIDGIAIGPSAGSCGTAAYSRKQVIVRDIMSDPLWEDFRDLAAQHGLRACWSTPILSASRTVLGTFAVYYRHAAEPDPDDESVIEGLTSVAVLAIEHSRAKNELAESEEKFRSLSRCIRTGVFMLDARGAFSYVTPRFIELASFEYEKTFDYWFEVATGDAHRAAEWRAIIDSRSEHSDTFAIRREGNELQVSLQITPMRSSSGEHLGYVGTLEDVSERVATATALERESALRLAIEESISEGIAATDLGGSQTYVNRAFAEMVGWPAEALIGAKAPFVYWPRETADAIERALAAASAATAPRAALELRLQRQNGELFDAVVRLAPLTGSGGEVAGWVAAVTDLSVGRSDFGKARRFGNR